MLFKLLSSFFNYLIKIILSLLVVGNLYLQTSPVVNPVLMTVKKILFWVIPVITLMVIWQDCETCSCSSETKNNIKK